MSTRVLILSASVGSGHKVAAAAIEQAFRARPGVEIQNQDALKLTSRLYQVTAADAYFALVKDNPWAVGWLYDQNDEPFKTQVGLMNILTMLNAQPLVRLIQDYDPDITVCTHFMPAAMVAQLLSQEQLHTTLAIVTTDYDFQGMWLSRAFNRYFVAQDEARAQLIALGIDAKRITVSGIPIGPEFSASCDPAAIRERYQLRSDLPTLLVSAGAFGGGPAQEIVSRIMQMETPVQTVVVCGRNRLLCEEVTALTAGQAERFRVLGFTHEMHALMRVATLFVGKPGGLTSAECMAAGLPMVIVNPIPGQEERNSDRLLENGAAVRSNSLLTIGYKIDALLREPGRIEAMRAATARLARPDAAQVVVETLLADTLEPLRFSRAERRQILAVARGEAEPDSAPAPSEEGVALFNDETGVYLGEITPQQLQFLIDHLEEEGPDDVTYYIDTPTLTFLAGHGADADLVATLRAALEPQGHVELRYVRPGEP
ncbi:MAG: glycosyltransferase [Chloroflexaceae bacterium]